MSESTYTIRERGLVVFWEGNRIDFTLRDPNKGVAKATLLFSNIEKSEDGNALCAKDTVLLDGKPIRAVCKVFDRKTGERIPNRIGVVWNADPDAEPINLGLTKARNGGKDYYYRGLETANDRARPKTMDDVFNMDFGQPSKPETDEIPF